MEIVTEPRGKKHLAALDGMRGLAITLVFAFHALGAGFGRDAPGWAGWHRTWPLPLSFWTLLPAYLGWAGVAMFFVVSGFCIHLSHARSGEVGLGKFFVRRFFRIYPPYLAALLFFALLFPTTRLGFTSRHEVDQLLTHVLLIHNFLGPGFMYGINPAFWSIGVEVQLYLLYPVLLAMVKWAGWRGALGLMAGVELALRIAFGFYDPDAPGRLWLLGNPLMYGFSWALGSHLAKCWLRGETLPLRNFPAWPWAALAVASYFVEPCYGLGFMLWALATAALLARLLTGDSGVWRGFWHQPGLRRIGLISYSIYLLHQPLEEWAGQGSHSLVVGSPSLRCIGLAASLLTFPAILLISWGYYHTLELPSLASGRWFLAKNRPAARDAREA